MDVWMDAWGDVKMDGWIDVGMNKDKYKVSESAGLMTCKVW